MKPLSRIKARGANGIAFYMMLVLAFICSIQLYYKTGLAQLLQNSKLTVKKESAEASRPKFNVLPEKSLKPWHGNGTDERVFVFDAYLTSSNEVTLVTIRKCRSQKRLYLHLQNNQSFLTVPLHSSPIQGYCPWQFAPKKVGLCTDDKKYLSQKTLPEVFVSDSMGFSAENKLRLLDVRQKKRKHKLAVCLQPIFLFADWTLLIQFFETWIYNGATKFFIYVQSMAPEVDELLRVYENDSKIDVERVHWAPLPMTGDSTDANDYVYRGEVVTSVNDCVLRARAQAELVVSSDLDEIIVSFNGSLLSLISRLRKKYPTTAAFLFRTRMASFQNLWATAQGPSEISFKALADINIEEKVWPVGRRSKLIMIPEFIKKAHVHTVLALEKNHVYLTLDPKTGIVLHLRRILRGIYNDTNAFKSSLLAPNVPAYDRQWRQRQDAIARVDGIVLLKNKNWPNRGLKVLEEVESCRRGMEGEKMHTCNSYFKCVGNITAVAEDEWIWADQRWSVV